MFNSEGFATDSTHTRSSSVHEESVSKVRVNDAESAQYNLLSKAHAKSSTLWLCAVLDVPHLAVSSVSLSAAPLAHTSLSYWSLKIAWWHISGTKWKLKSCLGCPVCQLISMNSYMSWNPHKVTFTHGTKCCVYHWLGSSWSTSLVTRSHYLKNPNRRPDPLTQSQQNRPGHSNYDYTQRSAYDQTPHCEYANLALILGQNDNCTLIDETGSRFPVRSMGYQFWKCLTRI